MSKANACTNCLLLKNFLKWRTVGMDCKAYEDRGDNLLFFVHVWYLIWMQSVSLEWMNEWKTIAVVQNHSPFKALNTYQLSFFHYFLFYWHNLEIIRGVCFLYSLYRKWKNNEKENFLLVFQLAFAYLPFKLCYTLRIRKKNVERKVLPELLILFPILIFTLSLHEEYRFKKQMQFHPPPYWVMSVCACEVSSSQLTPGDFMNEWHPQCSVLSIPAERLFTLL